MSALPSHLSLGRMGRGQTPLRKAAIHRDHQDSRRTRSLSNRFKLSNRLSFYAIRSPTISKDRTTARVTPNLPPSGGYRGNFSHSGLKSPIFVHGGLPTRAAHTFAPPKFSGLRRF